MNSFFLRSRESDHLWLVCPDPRQDFTTAPATRTQRSKRNQDVVLRGTDTSMDRVVLWHSRQPTDGVGKARTQRQGYGPLCTVGGV